MTAFAQDYINKVEVCNYVCVRANMRCACVTVQHSSVAGLSVKLCVNELRLR